MLRQEKRMCGRSVLWTGVVFAGMLTAILLFGGCGAGKGDGKNTSSGGGADPLRVESKEFDYNKAKAKIAGEIKDSEGYYLQESFSRSGLSEEEWSSVLEPFADIIALRFEDDSFAFEGQEELWSVRGMFRDKEGYTYVISGNGIRMLDPDGGVMAEKDYSAEKGDPLATVGDPVLSETGEIVFPVFHEMKMVDLVSFDRETGRERLLGQMEDRYFRNPLCALRGSMLFYRSEDWIVSWDLATGERMRFFDLKNAGIQQRNVVMAFSDEGVPMLYIGGRTSSFELPGSLDGDELVVILGSEPMETGLTIRIADLGGGYDNGYVSSGVGAYRVEHQDILFSYETWKKDDEAEDYRTRMLAELVSGKGADILCLKDREDLAMLREKGAIASLEGLISRETLDDLLPGVLELGTAGGELVGIVPVVSALTLGVPADNWDGDSWSMREFMEQTEKQGKKYAWIGSNGSRYWSSAYDILQYAVIPNLEDMGLIDYQNGTARLDSEEYVELLEFCKKYGMKADLGDEYENCLKNRESMANNIGLLYNYNYFEALYKIYAGQEIRICGFPGGDTGCNYLLAPKWLAVSQKAAEDPQKRKEISAFLEYLLSEACQKNVVFYLSVRRPTPENSYESGAEWSGWGDNRSRKIVLMGKEEYATYRKEDGSTCLKDFVAFLESCRAEPDRTSKLSRIIFEEADIYFQDGRGAEEAARITQNRVQLYLNERK